jgi:hypothetical protein
MPDNGASVGMFARTASATGFAPVRKSLRAALTMSLSIALSVLVISEIPTIRTDSISSPDCFASADTFP